MKTFATKDKRSAPAVRRARPYAHRPMGPVQMVQQGAVRRILRSTGAQAKLTIGQPNDKYEQEADRVADQVMAMPEPKLQRREESEEEEETIQAKPLWDGTRSLIQRQAEEDEEETVQAKAIQPRNASDHVAPPAAPLKGRLASLSGGGRALSKPLRTFFESRFGYDFQLVRIHTGHTAAYLTRQLKARAFATGKDIVFGAGQYRPGTTAGQRLIAHELAHVVQQNPRASVRGSGALQRSNKGAAQAPVKLNASHSYPLIQRRLSAGSICNKKKYQRRIMPILIFSRAQDKPGGPIKRRHILGPFRCESPRYAVKEGTRLLGNTATISGYRKQLQMRAAGEKSIIEWIYNTYLKTVSAAANYIDFILKLHRFTGVTPAKPGTKPKAVVAGETRAFISDVLRKWHLLGKYGPISGSNPFDKWATELHEKHHEKTILNIPQIRVATIKIRQAKQALLADPKLKRHHGKIRATAPKHIPKLMVDIGVLLESKRIELDNKIRITKGGSGRPDRMAGDLIPQRKKALEDEESFEKHRSDLKRQLQSLYTKYEQWMKNARNFATEDLKAYCLSWQAMQMAIQFIDRCLAGARRRGRGRPIRRKRRYPSTRQSQGVRSQIQKSVQMMREPAPYVQRAPT